MCLLLLQWRPSHSEELGLPPSAAARRTWVPGEKREEWIYFNMLWNKIPLQLEMVMSQSELITFENPCSAVVVATRHNAI